MTKSLKYFAPACLVFCLTAWALPAIAQNTVFVNGSTGNDAWSGVCALWDGATCGPKHSIQAGINVASDGWVVEVADGTYSGVGNSPLDLGGRDILLKSSNGRDVCVIDCLLNTRAFYFNLHQGDAIVDGFTIRNGYATGPAIYCDSSNPTFRNCRFQSNQGGAIYLTDGQTVKFQDSEFIDNRRQVGAAIEVHSPSRVSATNCTFLKNSATSSGGAVYISGSSLSTFDGCVFRNNTAVSDGGALRSDSSNLNITHCLFQGNLAGRNGGAACFMPSGDITFRRNRVIDNRASMNGGGCFGSFNFVAGDCILSRNWAGNDGGAVYGRISAVNCTICDNSAVRRGGAHFADDVSRLTNCIVRSNSALKGRQLTLDQTCTIENTNLEGGTAGIDFDYSGVLVAGPGLIDADAHFLVDRDYHLASDSPCIDAGAIVTTPALGATDCDGAPRSLSTSGDPIPDMGAYEVNPTGTAIAIPQIVEIFLPFGSVQPPVAPVPLANSGGGSLDWQASVSCGWLAVTPGNGTINPNSGPASLTLTPNMSGLARGNYECELSIESANAANSPVRTRLLVHVTESLKVPAPYPTIQSAINAAIADGDQVVVVDGVHQGLGNRAIDLQGKRIVVRSENGPAACVIDCQGAGRGFYLHSNETSDTRISGFTIMNGAAPKGAAIFCEANACPKIESCVIRNNVAPGVNGALQGSQSSMVIRNCVVRNNTGDGVRLVGGGATVERCLIASNTGAGIAANSVSVQRCIVSANGHTGIFLTGTATVSSIRDTIVTGNMPDSVQAAAGINLGEIEGVDIVNCSIVFNLGGRGGGIVTSASCYDWMSIANCIIRNNFQSIGSEIDVWCTGCSPINNFHHNNVRNGIGGLSSSGGACTLPWGTTNINTDPKFASATDFHLTAISPCIDAGSLNPPPEVSNLDHDGLQRVTDGNGDGSSVVDLGAYEFQPNPFPSGDTNCDGAVTANDVSSFILALLSPDVYWTLVPACMANRADVNSDGAINGKDIASLVNEIVSP